MAQQQQQQNVKKGGNDFSYGVNKANMETFTRKELLVMINTGVMMNALIPRDSKNLTANEKANFTLQLPFCNLSELDLRHFNLERSNFFVRTNML